MYSHIRRKYPAPWQPSFSSKHIIETNRLTKFLEDWTINVASQVTNVLTKFHREINFLTPGGHKNAPPLGGHVFQQFYRKVLGPIRPEISDWDEKAWGRKSLLSIQPTGTIFCQVLNWTINVASRALSRREEKWPAPLRPCFFRTTITIFELVIDIIRTNVLTKFYEGWTINANSIVKYATPPGGHFHENRTIDVVFRVKNAPPPKPISNSCTMSLGRNYLLTKFHEDLIINVASRLLTRQNDPTPGNHFFNQHFFDSLEINVASRVLTRYFYSSEITTKLYNEKSPGQLRPCFSSNRNYFELVQDIIRTNVLTKFHKDWTINAQTLSIFELIQDIVKTNVLTKFHEDWTINVTFRVLTSFHYRYMKNAPWWQYTIETNLQTKFHEDPTMNQASTMLTRQLFMSHNRRQTLEKM
ncbi:hypothetical protein DPMN_079997 [Dreissena polymorpha]|uniref:Uncharacterized protein n=1 Tax=Dreissena polymorpha TaxID=45954 RepID=A0A9D3YTM2_DREPO|nr:hypothetical protein DPMN_079997 [Dreissena polymorpha]